MNFIRQPLSVTNTNKVIKQCCIRRGSSNVKHRRKQMRTKQSRLIQTGMSLLCLHHATTVTSTATALPFSCHYSCASLMHCAFSAESQLRGWGGTLVWGCRFLSACSVCYLLVPALLAAVSSGRPEVLAFSSKHPCVKVAHCFVMVVNR